MILSTIVGWDFPFLLGACFASSFCGGDGDPPIWIGVAAPKFVPGAIAATWLAYVMYVPALAARAPLGATKATTGMADCSTSWMIARIEVSRPPGVSRRKMISAPWPLRALSIPLRT